TWNATAGDTTLNFGGGTLAPGASCSVHVDITGTTAGVKSNQVLVTDSTQSGIVNNPSNIATLTVVAPPSISKSFGASTIPLNGTTTLTFTIMHPNTTTSLTGVGFTDSLPAGLQVAATPGASTTCGGTFAPNAGDTTLTFSGGTTSAGGTCTVMVNVT